MTAQNFYSEYYDFYLTLKGNLAVRDESIARANVNIRSKYIGKSGEKKEAKGKMNLDKDSDIIQIEAAQHEFPHTYHRITENRIETLGEEIFDAVFVDEIGKDFQKAYDETEKEGVGLRILLDIAPNLTWFPWEIARYENRFLATEIRTPFLRIFTGKTKAINLKKFKMPKVLAVLSNLEMLSGVDVTLERTNLKHIILHENKSKFGGFESIMPKPGDRSSNPSFDDIETVLNKTRVKSEDPFNIIHFLAHGEFNEEKKVSAIILRPTKDQESQGETSIKASGIKMVEKLGSERSIGLVVLNACSTGRILQGVPSLVSELLQISPAVVAMRKEIGKEVAIDFTIHFYENLTPQNAEVAIQTTRQKLHTKNGRTLDFSIPVLYLGCDEESRIPVNRIFSRKTLSTPLWTPGTKLNPAGVIAQNLLKLHDKSLETEIECNNWFFNEDKDLKVSRLMKPALLQKQLFRSFSEVLERTSQLICTTFSHTEPIWNEYCGCLDMDMKKLVELPTQGGAALEIRETINHWHQGYSDLENLVCHIVTASKWV